jgi:hypothetical protein
VAPDSDANLLPLRYGVLEMLYKTAEKTTAKSVATNATRQRRPTLFGNSPTLHHVVSDTRERAAAHDRPAT